MQEVKNDGKSPDVTVLGGKNGVNVDKQKYLVVREAILEALRAAGEMTFKALTEDV